MQALINGKIITMAQKGEQVEGNILIEDGKIIAVGAGEIPSQSIVKDLKGKYVLPGFIDPHSHIGLFEEGLGLENADGNEMTSPNTAGVSALDAINPGDTAFKESLAAGYTTVLVMPGSGNVIGGQCVLIKTSGKVVDEMVVQYPAGVKMAFGGNPKNEFPGKAKNHPLTRMGVAATLREALYQARDYQEKRAKGEREYDSSLEVLARLLNKELMARIHVARSDDILTIIRIAQEFDFKFSLEHVTEGHLTAAEIANANIPCVIGPMFSPRSASETKNLSFITPGILDKAGVKVAFTCDHPIIPLKYGLYQAICAVKAGMEPYAALAALTINAAEIAGVKENLGSIEAGKEADLVVFSDHPFQLKAQVEKVYLKGEEVVS